MKIVELRSENIKRIKAIEIKPDKNVVVLSGKNGAGKTSILDSIYIGLTGKQPEQPIKKGSEKALIKIDLEEYLIKKIITQKGSRLEVTTKDGDVMRSPQSVLDSLIGSLTFDPLEFAGMKKQDRKNLLLNLAKIDFTGIDEKKESIYQHRTIIGREGQILKGQLEKFDVIEFKDVPEKEVSINELNKEYLDIRDSIDEYKNNKGRIGEIDKRLKNLQKEIEVLKKEKAEYGKLLKDIDIDSLVKKQKELYETLSKSEEINQKIREKQEWNIVSKSHQRKQVEYQKATDAISSLDQEKTEMIKNAKMPIGGLAFGDDDVLYNDIPFSQLSSGEELTVSMAIAMSLNPKLKIIRITDGSLLDSEHMKIIQNMAGEKDYQVWIEKVDETGKVGIYIEDGEVSNIN